MKEKGYRLNYVCNLNSLCPNSQWLLLKEDNDKRYQSRKE
jgi:hypothetical protein